MSHIDFRLKIKDQRERQSSMLAKSVEELQNSFESDRGRIINSAAIRRLQQKTQVFPLEKNAAVRSRLTHSMEVQQAGRFIVQRIFKQLSEQQQALWGLTNLERPIESLVEMACLMHDIGNPPFGHFGEQAINQWFAEHLSPLSLSASATNCAPIFAQRNDLAQDILQFEGNAQAIRLIHSLLHLNLTYTQAAGILKYTRLGTTPKPSDPHDYLAKKVGFYYSEQDYIQGLTRCLAMAEGCRHPISYIMEAADDISYCLADIEDAVEKGILTTARLSELMLEVYEQQLHAFELDASAPMAEMKLWLRAASDAAHYFISLRVSLSHLLVNHAAKQFIDNIEQVYHGTFNNALLEDRSTAHAVTASLKKIAREQVFCDPEVEQLELQGYRIISGLLDCYRPLLALDHKQFSAVLSAAKHAPLIPKHLAKKLPAKHLASYHQALASLTCTDQTFADLEFYYRCRLLQDYISGMTDQFAYDEYRSLMVID